MRQGTTERLLSSGQISPFLFLFLFFYFFLFIIHLGSQQANEQAYLLRAKFNKLLLINAVEKDFIKFILNEGFNNWQKF